MQRSWRFITPFEFRELKKRVEPQKIRSGRPTNIKNTDVSKEEWLDVIGKYKQTDDNKLL